MRYNIELGHAADLLVRDLLALRCGETLVITADTESDEAVVDATARAAYSVGAIPMVVWTATPPGVGKAADPALPVESLTGALAGADAWVEFNRQWLLYSTPYERAFRENDRLRHLCLVGMNADMMVRCIGKVDLTALADFQMAFADRLLATDHVRIVTPAGTNIELRHAQGRPVKCRLGRAHQPGSEMLAGQISVAPQFDTIAGTVVFDGSVYPPIGRLHSPINLEVACGQIQHIVGGRQARAFRAWLNGFNDPQMLNMAHVSYGFNPGAALSGNILEDERVWGGTEWGMGSVGPSLLPSLGVPAVSHSDGTCLDASVWLDGVQVMDEGQVVDEALKALADRVAGGLGI